MLSKKSQYVKINHTASSQITCDKGPSMRRALFTPPKSIDMLSFKNPITLCNLDVTQLLFSIWPQQYVKMQKKFAQYHNAVSSLWMIFFFFFTFTIFEYLPCLQANNLLWMIWNSGDLLILVYLTFKINKVDTVCFANLGEIIFWFWF